MKKFNRTYLMSIVWLAIAAVILWQTTILPEKFVSNEPGPKLFPYISAVGIAVCSILAMITEGPKETKEGSKAFMDKAGWMKIFLLLGECVLFALGMNWIGFWITSMVGMFVFIWTLKEKKKINIIFAILLSICLGSICYFGFTKVFSIPLPKGKLWKMLKIKMP